jgi:hypothetical protein
MRRRCKLALTNAHYCLSKALSRCREQSCVARQSSRIRTVAQRNLSRRVRSRRGRGRGRLLTRSLEGDCRGRELGGQRGVEQLESGGALGGKRGKHTTLMLFAKWLVETPGFGGDKTR